MNDHDWLTQELRSLHWYAHYLREALTDDDLPQAGKNGAAAAGKYLVEWEDVIPDTDPQFGYVDDLFVVFMGLEEILKRGGRHGKSYGDKQLASGATIAATVTDAKKRFKSFWAFMNAEVGAGFQHIARAVKKDKEYTAKLVAMLDNYVEAYQQAPRPIDPIEPDPLTKFLARYRVKRA